jgi:hypothetical protein
MPCSSAKAVGVERYYLFSRAAAGVGRALTKNASRASDGKSYAAKYRVPRLGTLLGIVRW